MILALVVGLLLAGSIIKGVIGLGMPMIAIPVLTLFIGLPQAVAIVALPVAAANGWQCWQFRKSGRTLPFLSPFLITGSLGLLAGTVFLATAPSTLLEIGLASVVMIYLVLRAMHPDFIMSRGTGRRLAPAIGLGSGLLHGATGISAPIGITYFHSMKLERPEFIFATGAMFLLYASMQVPLLGWAGFLSGTNLIYGLFAIPTSAVGLYIGNRIGRHMNPVLFDRLVLLVLCLTAGLLMWRGLSDIVT
ncbi:hypothetical protein N177_0643 [Lutibaculum baratangense AMV1]|uniref:Probable membrane transporter protein n=2 Tax=Lutibaculum TaxID=1358438 RepID=V4RNL1_9HYPH|nr:hypothetical protein N177_0643 [Lutibaculum baratangense AMV1]